MAGLFAFDGMRVLITGAGKGIGAQTARRLGEAGARVCATDIDSGAAEATAKVVTAAGGEGLALTLDVADEASWQAAVQAMVAAWGGLDGLVNNAGIFRLQPLFEATLADFRATTAINLDGVFLGMKVAGAAMAQSGGGSIVNLSSLYGIVGSQGLTAYCASKGGVRLMTKAAAIELGRAGTGIRVNSVHPGPIATDMLMDPLKGMAAAGMLPSVDVALDMLTQRTPGGRVGQADDIAGAILFLLSDASRHMTGAEIVVDGGYTIE
jgi:NAD(P)-dependent dehydrogenase (short-subunit alcohol dehydrogenase family)